MKRIASPVALTFLVSTPALADNPYAGQTLTQAIESMAVSDIDVIVGQPHVSQGPAGTDDNYNGSHGSAITVTNSSSISMTPPSTDALVIGLQAASIGGNGYTPDGNDNGGDGGNGNVVTVTNDVGADITISASSSVTLQNGVIGLLASSRGGNGGSLNPGVLDHYGGTAGSSANITLNSNSKVSLGAEGTPLNGGSHAAWGVVAQSIGGRGGQHAKGADADDDDPTGNGGGGGTVVSNVTGDVSVYWNPADQDGDDCTGNEALGVKNCSSVAAVVASSVGGTGGQVTWTKDQGGNGGHAATATANVGAQDSNTGAITNITASTSQATLDDSAAIMVISAGGHGGSYGTDDATGGDGGNADGASANVYYSNVQTFGDSLSGVLVLSHGGDGGGNAPGTSSDDSNGGNGGLAGPAGANLVGSSVTTSGSMAYGVLVQAIGGLGGLGSDQGGQGANGGTAYAELDSGSSVTTSGDYAAAVVAQSLAGAGGSGGAWTSWIDGSSGEGGAGGSGGSAKLSTYATLRTSGDYAHGALVQSIGGSGGTGAAAGGVVALGGSGGRGGNGGDLTDMLLGGAITTAGTGAIGALVQSIGGGGGNAGSASGVISVGGEGGTASTGGAVDVNVDGRIVTSGEAGIGLLGQSIGGGGGNAGSSAGVSAVGGNGGAGGDGGTVTLQLNSGSTVTTSGQYAHGTVAQSIGGGGGNGGSVFSLAVSGDGLVPPALGGRGGVGGKGSQVNVVGTQAAIATTGNGATGVLAQSIGGGGGSGGSSMQDSLSVISLVIGGAGADGANSDDVTVSMTDSTIHTQGSAAPAITAQSIGGGGGNGGAAHGKTVNAFFGTDIAIGGNAGGGSGSGTVTVDLSNSTVTTAGGQSNTSISDSYGVLAQAIGGGGGNGGSAQANNLDIGVSTPDGSLAISTTMALGGSGSSGGNGGILNVGLTDGARVSTGGIGSHGVLAQTIGGGGGAGGASHAMSTSSTTPGADDTLQIRVSTALGGSGGDGGHGGQVGLHVDATSSITTNDDFSNALMAQSIGGGGGNAGVGSSKAGGSGKAITTTIGVGGSGGGGGYGGEMKAQLDAGSLLQTYGSGSRGMLLQSIGGGGGASQGGTVQLSGSGADGDGDAYKANVSVSLGATGAVAGDGGAVTVIAQGAISTKGGDADGILAQSIGGGGGLAGSAGSDAGGDGSSSAGTAGTLVGDGDDDSNSYAMNLAVGGQGGIGGGGGAVSLTDFTGTVATQGTYADGIVLQSIGGGGGTGGTATASGVTGSTNVTMAVGGQGGAAGNGGTVIIDLQGDGTMNKGAISTTGDVAYGLLAQSIGGGGGQGADGSANTAKSSDSTSSVTLGASGASPNGGWGGKINTGDHSSVLSVSTQGFNSHAIVLQSIGGGGGTASVATVGVTGDDSTPNFDLTLGGGGGKGNSGTSSPVTESSGGQIGVEAWLGVTTAGEHALGLVAQSIGGGGGIIASGAASNVNKIAISGDATSQNLAGGDISITIGNVGSQTNSNNPSVVSTTGTGAHGIVLQSIGGGGGIAGYTANGALSAGWNGTQSESIRGDSNSGGDVTLEYEGVLQTTGDGAFGIIAQSIADGGGLAGDHAGSYAGSAYDHSAAGAGGSTAGNVKVIQSNTLTVAGENAYAIFAQSDGNVNNDSAVKVYIGGTVTATASSGGGVWIDGTAQTNLVTIDAGGSLSAATAINNTGTQDVAVTNNGNLAGNLNLKGTASAMGMVENFGTLLNADNIHGHVINHGDFLVGESLGKASTHVTGDFTQAPDGTLHIGADFIDQTADALQVDGTARLNGKIRVNPSRLMPNRSVVFLKSDNIHPDTALQNASVLFDYATQYSGDQATVTVGQAHFDTVSQSYGAGRNLRELGSHLQDIWARGGNEELAGVYATLDQAAGQGGATFTDALSSLAPGISAAPAALKQADMARFAGSLLSCPHYEGAELRLSESSCVWGNIAARTTSVDGSHGTSSFDASGVTYQVGVQQRIAPQWFVGVSAAYENGHISADDGRQSLSGDTGYLGASLKYENGPWMVAGTLAGSYGSYDSTRYIRLPGFNASAKSSPDVMSLGQRLRVAYTHNMGKAYIKPVVDLDLIYTRMPSYSEHGAGALNLNYESSDTWAAILTPGVEVGGRIDLDKDYVLRPYLNVGLSLSSTDRWDSYARLDAAPAGSRSAKSTLDAGRTFARVTGGVQLFGGDQFDVRLQYDGLFSSQVRSHGGTLKASWRY